MAVTFTLNLNTKEAEAALAKLGRRAPRVVARALNRAGGSARTFTTRAVAKDMGVGSKVIRDRVSVVKATPASQRFTLKASAKRLPLTAFKASGPEPSRGRGRGVSYRGKEGRVRLPHAFLATMGSGHRGVFQRTTSARLPIVELLGPSIWHVFTKHADAGLQHGRDQLLKNLRHEIRFAMTAE